LLPGHLNELRTLDMELQEDLSELQQAIDEVLKYWAKQLESKRGIKYMAEQAVKSPEYNQVVDYARNIVDAMARWRNTAQAVSGVISEEMPRIRVVNMFSKAYKHEVLIYAYTPNNHSLTHTHTHTHARPHAHSRARTHTHASHTHTHAQVTITHTHRTHIHKEPDLIAF
jgi:hypothetical protein